MATPPVPPLPPATAVYPAARPVSPPTASATPAEPRLMDRNHQPKARAKPRGIVRWKRECKRCEETNRTRIVKAEGCCWRWHLAAKPTGTQPTVNAVLVHRQFAHLPGEICAPWRCGADGRGGRVVPYLMRPGARSRSLSGLGRRLQFGRSGPFFAGFLPHSYGYGSANPAKTVHAGAKLRYDAPNPTGS